MCLGWSLWAWRAGAAGEGLWQLPGEGGRKHANHTPTTRRPHARRSSPAGNLEKCPCPCFRSRCPPISVPGSQCAGLSPLHVASCPLPPCLAYQAHLPCTSSSPSSCPTASPSPRARAWQTAPPGQQLQERRPDECCLQRVRPPWACRRGSARGAPSPAQMPTHWPQQSRAASRQRRRSCAPGLRELRGVRGLQQSLGAWAAGLRWGHLQHGPLTGWQAREGRAPPPPLSSAGSERLPPRRVLPGPRRPQQGPCSACGRRLPPRVGVVLIRLV